MEGNFLSMSEYVIVIQNIPLGSKMTPLGSMRVKSIKNYVSFTNIINFFDNEYVL